MLPTASWPHAAVICLVVAMFWSGVIDVTIRSFALVSYSAVDRESRLVGADRAVTATPATSGRRCHAPTQHRPLSGVGKQAAVPGRAHLYTKGLEQIPLMRALNASSRIRLGSLLVWSGLVDPQTIGPRKSGADSFRHGVPETSGEANAAPQKRMGRGISAIAQISSQERQGRAFPRQTLSLDPPPTGVPMSLLKPPAGIVRIKVPAPLKTLAVTGPLLT